MTSRLKYIQNIIASVGLRAFLALCLSSISPAFAAADTAASPELQFQAAVSLGQAKKWPEAAQATAQWIGTFGETPQALSNLALFENKAGRIGFALAAARRTVELKPYSSRGQRTVQSLEERRAPISRDISPVAGFWNSTVQRIPLAGWVVLNILLVWFFISNLLSTTNQKFKRIFAGTLFVFSMTFTISGIYLSLQKRATVAQDIKVKSTPTDDGVEIFDIPIGYEVKVLEKRDGWMQIALDGVGEGWVKPEAVVIHREISKSYP